MMLPYPALILASAMATVYRHARNFKGVESHEGNHTSDVQALLRFRSSITGDDVVNQVFVDVR
jgi:predicted secreted Zn-dependent protease